MFDLLVVDVVIVQLWLWIGCFGLLWSYGFSGFGLFVVALDCLVFVLDIDCWVFVLMACGLSLDLILICDLGFRYIGALLLWFDGCDCCNGFGVF